MSSIQRIENPRSVAGELKFDRLNGAVRAWSIASVEGPPQIVCATKSSESSRSFWDIHLSRDVECDSLAECFTDAEEQARLEGIHALRLYLDDPTSKLRQYVSDSPRRWVFRQAKPRSGGRIREQWVLPIVLSPIPIAVIGANPEGRGGELAKALQQYPHLVRIAAVVDKNEEVREYWQGQDVETASLVQDIVKKEVPIRAAVLALPHCFYPAIRRECMQLGWSLWHEKPLVCSLQEWDELNKALQHYPVPIVVGVQRRAHPSYVLLRELLQSEAADVISIELSFGHSLVAPGWRGDPGQSAGGALIDCGYHALDLAHFLLDANVEPVSCNLWVGDLNENPRPAREGELETAATIVGRCGPTWVRILIDRAGTKCEQVRVWRGNRVWLADRQGLSQGDETLYRCERDWALAESAQIGELVLQTIAPAQAGPPDIWEHLSSIRIIRQAESLAPMLGLFKKESGDG